MKTWQRTTENGMEIRNYRPEPDFEEFSYSSLHIIEGQIDGKYRYMISFETEEKLSDRYVRFSIEANKST